MPISADSAETMALKALTWLVASEDLLAVFLNSSGVSESDLKNRAAEPEFLGSVLDFVMMDDDWVIDFCDANQVSYEQPMLARAMLPGGEQVHWT